MRIEAQASPADGGGDVYYKLYGTGTLQDKEIAKIKFRHFASSHPPQVEVGADAGEIQKDAIITDQSSGSVDVQQTLQQLGGRSATQGKTGSRVSSDPESGEQLGYEVNAKAIKFFEKPENQKAWASIVKKFMDDNHLDLIQPGQAPPTLANYGMMSSWVEKNSRALNYRYRKWTRSNDPDNPQSESDVKHWLLAALASAMDRMGLLPEACKRKIHGLIQEYQIRSYVREMLKLLRS